LVLSGLNCTGSNANLQRDIDYFTVCALPIDYNDINPCSRICGVQALPFSPIGGQETIAHRPPIRIPRVFALE
jgi:hypothetical protein